MDALRSAEAVWRGPALGGVTGRILAGEAVKLDEQRIRMAEERIAAELALGRGEDLVAGLSALLGAHPTRERLRGQLMLALYRAGRRSEALDVYRRGRAALVEEHGLEPGVELTRLHDAILRGDPDLVPAARRRRCIAVGGGHAQLTGNGAPRRQDSWSNPVTSAAPLPHPHPTPSATQP